MIRTLLVDDHAVVRSGFLRLLEQAGGISVVAECGDVPGGYEAFCQHQPDVSVIDLSLSGSSGLELLKRMLLRSPEARVLIISMHDSPHVVQRAFNGGARGFVSKQADPDCLIAAVRQVAAGQRYLSPGLDPQSMPGTDSVDQLLASLSQREFEIFQLLVKGTSLAECAELLHLSQKTVANHQTVIKDKLQVKTTAAMVHLALQAGLVPKL